MSEASSRRIADAIYGGFTLLALAVLYHGCLVG